MRLPLFVFSVATLVVGASCSPAPGEEAPTEGGEEAEEALGVPLTEPDETDSPTRTAAQALDVAGVSSFIDVRGVGDSGWARTHQGTPIAADFGAALDRFDATGRGYRGHVSFLNWETVVGSSCARFANVYSPGRSYAFLSRPENLTQAYDRGFNLVGLSNNHARDCADPSGEALTRRSMTELARSGVLWHGVGLDAATKPRVKVETFRAAGGSVRVAFGSIYFGSARSCDLAVCAADKGALFKNLREAAADLRIVAIHSMDPGTQAEAVNAGVEFVRDFGGDVVFGHGPHVWMPVRVVRKSAGGKGVVFESLGNFLHPSLAAQPKNFVGRALFDRATFELRQVQILPVHNTGMDVKWSALDASHHPANLQWSPSERGVYANVKK